MAFPILVCLDGSADGEAVIPQVIGLARPLEADVVLLHVVEAPAGPEEMKRQPQLAQVAEDTQRRAEAYLSGLENRVKTDGLGISHATVMGDPANQIVSYAQAHGVDLIALATHGRSGPQRWIYGSVAEKVLHLAHQPVLLVRSTAELVSAPQAVKDILVPLDGSDLAVAALPLAETLATRLGASIMLLQSVEIPAYAYSAEDLSNVPSFNFGELLDLLQQGAREHLDRMAAEVKKTGVRVSTKVVVGHPSDHIIAQAQQPGCLVVMSTHGHSGLIGTLLGSVARQVLRSDATVITVPPGATGLA